MKTISTIEVFHYFPSQKLPFDQTSKTSSPIITSRSRELFGQIRVIRWHFQNQPTRGKRWNSKAPSQHTHTRTPGEWVISVQSRDILINFPAGSLPHSSGRWAASCCWVRVHEVARARYVSNNIDLVFGVKWALRLRGCFRNVRRYELGIGTLVTLHTEHTGNLKWKIVGGVSIDEL